MRARLDEMKEAALQERLRLFYVAMTRAEKWLIVAAAGELSKDESSWYQITAAALARLRAEQMVLIRADAHLDRVAHRVHKRRLLMGWPVLNVVHVACRDVLNDAYAGRKAR